MRRIREIECLYYKIYLSRKNFILLIISLLSIVLVSYFSLNLGFNEEEFSFIKNTYIQEYLESTSNFIMILNCAIIPVISLLELKEESTTINYILIPRVTRETLNFAKLISIIKIAIYYTIMELLIVGIFPLIFYPDFCLKISYLRICLFIILYSCFNVVIINLSIKIIKTFIVGAIPIIIYLILNIIKDNEWGKKFLPILIIDNQNLIFFQPVIVLFIAIIILSLLYLIKK